MSGFHLENIAFYGITFTTVNYNESLFGVCATQFDMMIVYMINFSNFYPMRMKWCAGVSFQKV